MGRVLVNDSTLTSIAEAIRLKLVTDRTYLPSEMPAAILQIGTEKIVLNKIQQLSEGWKFKLESTTSQENSTTYINTVDFSNWDSISVPHDWSIHLPFSESSLAGYEGGYLDGGDGWYQRELIICEDESEKRFFIHFDGSYQVTKVYVNGNFVGQNNYGYNPFTFEITDYVEPGLRNSLLVYVANRQPCSRWYTGSGLYRKVQLLIGENVDFGLDDVYITSPNLKQEYNSQNTVTLNVAANAAGSFDYVFEIFNQNGNLIYSAEDTHEEGIFNKTFQVPKPQLWQVNEGVHYCAQFTIKKNYKTYICGKIPFGYRYIEYDNNGFYLNGEKTFLKGMCMHHDLGALGAETNRSAIDRQIKTLKAMGCNAIRFAHNPPSQEYMTACMEEGIMCISEMFDTWTSTKKTYDFHRHFSTSMPYVIETAIKRDRNNPAVIMWSIGNEIIRTSPSYSVITGPQIAQSIIDEIHKWDISRPVTMGEDSPTNEVALAVMDVVDIIGINYGDQNEYNTVRTRHPHKCIYGSETTSALSSRGKYEHDEINLYCSSLDNDKVSWGDTAKDALVRHMQTIPYLAGMFVWTGFDYIGEPTPFNRYPAKSSYFGAIDLAGLPKDSFYIYRAAWTEEPFVHILTDWEGIEGEEKTILINTNCPAIKVTTKEVAINYTPNSSTSYALGGNIQAVVEFVPGELVVEGYNEDFTTVLATATKHTTVLPLQLKLTADKMKVNTQDGSLVFVTCEVVDQNDIAFKNVNNTITFTCQGGAIIATDAGNSASVEPLRIPSKKMFSGKVVAFVKPNKNANIVTVNASTPGLLSAQLTVECGNETIYNEEYYQFLDENIDGADFNYEDQSYGHASAFPLDGIVSGQKFTLGTLPAPLTQTTLYAEIDTSTINSVNQNILSIGSNIAGWSSENENGYNFHMYYPRELTNGTNKRIICAIVSQNAGVGMAQLGFTLSNQYEKLRIALNNNGLYINGALLMGGGENDIHSSAEIVGSGSMAAITNSRMYFFNTLINSANTISVGSQEGTGRSTATYVSVKVYDKVLTREQMATITAEGDIDEPDTPATPEIINTFTLPHQLIMSGSSTAMQVPILLAQNAMQNWSLVLSANNNFTNTTGGTGDEELFSSPECSVVYMPNHRIGIRFRDVTHEIGISTLSGDLFQLYITKSGNTLTIKNLLNDEQFTLTSSNTSFIDDEAYTVLGTNWRGTIKQLQIYDRAITLFEALTALPHVTSYSIANVGTEINIPTEVQIQNITPELSKARVAQLLTIHSADEDLTLTKTNCVWRVESEETADSVIAIASCDEINVPFHVTVLPKTIYDDETLLYELTTPRTFIASQQQTLDTHLQLLNGNNSFSIYMRFSGSTDNRSTSDTHTLLHCMHESGTWPGLSFQIDAGNYVFHWWDKNYRAFAYNNTAIHEMWLLHNSTGSSLEIYLDGQLVSTLTHTKSFDITQTFIVGSYQQTNGTKGRFWNGTVQELRVYNEIKTPVFLNE